jgi:hypothetical protein
LTFNKDLKLHMGPLGNIERAAKATSRSQGASLMTLQGPGSAMQQLTTRAGR